MEDYIRNFQATDYRNLFKFYNQHSKPIYSKCMVTYVWIDGTGEFLRSKIRSVDHNLVDHVDKVPSWNYDGSSTYQSVTDKSDILLKPVFLCNDPFHPYNNNKIALCEALHWDNRLKILNNHRTSCYQEASKYLNKKYWFSFEQEYTIINNSEQPYGWLKKNYTQGQGPNYCGVGAGRVVCRELADSLYQCLLYAGLEVSGDNAEVLLSQWEYQIGPCNDIEAADQLWVSRFILFRLAEDIGVDITLKPRPLKDAKWNGTGCHVNFSSEEMRQPNGIKYIIDAAEKMKETHEEDLKFYDLKCGEENKLRLSGINETASWKNYSYSIGSRGVSVRIPLHVDLEGKGYLEDRRPAGNCDPYLVIERILKSIEKS